MELESVLAHRLSDPESRRYSSFKGTTILSLRVTSTKLNYWLTLTITGSIFLCTPTREHRNSIQDSLPANNNQKLKQTYILELAVSATGEVNIVGSSIDVNGY
ncbi:hypothetical protein HZH68_006332 [Vespula germanica]|uniref:Uncharacterized protein n=1 Tax=Vespula germanica TaxID=30212 RepID=A0A834KB89_VESGE|nr:hypothetical protein HZH68_006332 [Vespula germanica]